MRRALRARVVEGPNALCPLMLTASYCLGLAKSAFGLHIRFLPFHLKADKNNFGEQTKPETGKMSVHVATAVRDLQNQTLWLCICTLVCFFVGAFLSWVILQLHIANACLLFHPSRASPPPLFQQPLSLSRPSVSPQGCGGMVELWKTMSKQGHGEFLGKSYTNTVLIHTTTVQSKCVKTVEVVKLIKFVVWPRSNFRIISHMGEWDVSKIGKFPTCPNQYFAFLLPLWSQEHPGKKMHVDNDAESSLSDVLLRNVLLASVKLWEISSLDLFVE